MNTKKMKSKAITLTILGILALVIALGTVSAAENFTITKSQIEFTPRDDSDTFIVRSTNLSEKFNVSFENDEGIDVTNQPYLFNEGGEDFEVTFSGDTVDINRSEIAVELVSGDIGNIDFGEEFSKDITVLNKDDSAENETLTLDFSNDLFCEDVPELVELDVEIDTSDIDVLNGFGEDEDYWYPLDEVEIPITIDNEDDYDVEDIEIEFCLYDVNEGECIMDEGDVDISDDGFDLDEGDDTDTFITLDIDPDELNGGSEDFRVFVKAIGEIDDNDSSNDGEETCSSDVYDNAEIRQDEFVVLNNVEMPETLQCGTQYTIRGDAWNIDDSDLDDDEVFLLVFNNELDIIETVEFGRGIDALDSEEFQAIIEVPEDVDEKTYGLSFNFYDDEDLDDNDLFELNNDDEDTSEYSVLSEVRECSPASFASATISASLQSEGVVSGEEFEVSATIINTADREITYTIGIENHEEWASSASANPTSVTLAQGDSEEVSITMTPNEEVSGSRTFNLKALSEGETIVDQPVEVSIAENTSNFDFINDDNWYLWLIGLINVILVIVIIIVAIRVATRK